MIFGYFWIIIASFQLFSFNLLGNGVLSFSANKKLLFFRRLELALSPIGAALDQARLSLGVLQHFSFGIGQQVCCICRSALQKDRHGSVNACGNFMEYVLFMIIDLSSASCWIFFSFLFEDFIPNGVGLFCNIFKFIVHNNFY